MKSLSTFCFLGLFLLSNQVWGNTFPQKIYQESYAKVWKALTEELSSFEIRGHHPIRGILTTRWVDDTNIQKWLNPEKNIEGSLTQIHAVLRKIKKKKKKGPQTQLTIYRKNLLRFENTMEWISTPSDGIFEKVLFHRLTRRLENLVPKEKIKN